MTQNKEQFVKSLPHGEIELHGDDETYQCTAGAITAMKIHVNDGMEFKHVDGECKKVSVRPAMHILVVMIGYDTEDRYAERISFSAPTEQEVEAFRDQINRIRWGIRPQQMMSWIEKTKSLLKVKP